jgi:hypothetical protein
VQPGRLITPLDVGGPDHLAPEMSFPKSAGVVRYSRREAHGTNGLGGGPRHSEVCVCGLRNVIVEQVLVIFGANPLLEGLLNAIIPLRERPGRVEGIRIVERDVDLHHLSAVDHPEALDDVQLLGILRVG